MLNFDLTAILTAAVGLLSLLCVCLFIFGRLGVGSVIAFLVAGLVVGQIRDLPMETVHRLYEFAEFGVVLLLFLIGLEMTPPQLRGLGRDAIALGLPQIAASAALIGGYVFWVSGVWNTMIVLGLGLSLSSTMVVVPLLTERGELQSSWGRKAFAILLAQDLAVVPFLVVVSAMAEPGIDNGSASSLYWAIFRAIVVVFGIIALGRFVLTRVLAETTRRANEPAFVCASFLAVLAAALASEKAGLSMALGTFLLGAILSVSPFGHRIAAIVEPVKSTLIALFFLSIGLSLDLEVVLASWPTLLLHIVVIITLKFAVLLVLALLSGMPMPDALRMALALPQCGEFGFVLFAAAQAGGLMTPELSALASVLIVISMLATPFLMRLAGEPRSSC